MNFLPTKEYCIVPGCGLVYRDHENVSMNWPKIHCSRKFYPPPPPKKNAIQYLRPFTILHNEGEA